MYEQEQWESHYLKDVSIIDESTLLFTFYLTAADWDISDDVIETRITLKNRASEFHDRLKRNLLNEWIYIEAKKGWIDFWEGEGYDYSNSFGMPYDDYETKVVPKSSSEWRKQYLEIHKEFYSLLGKKRFDLNEFKKEIIKQLEGEIEREKKYSLERGVLYDENAISNIFRIAVSVVKNSEPLGQFRKFMYLDDSNEPEKEQKKTK